MKNLLITLISLLFSISAARAQPPMLGLNFRQVYKAMAANPNAEIESDTNEQGIVVLKVLDPVKNTRSIYFFTGLLHCMAYNYVVRKGQYDSLQWQLAMFERKGQDWLDKPNNARYTLQEMQQPGWMLVSAKEIVIRDPFRYWTK